jgi:hypothetical protein
MTTSRLSTRKCVWCNLPLDAELTTDEVKVKYKGRYYHRSCKALANEYTADVPGALADILRRTKRRAAELDLDYDLGDDLEAMRFLMDLWERQQGSCADEGIPMRCDTDHELTFHLKPSLDRVDSSGGYTKDNVKLVTQRVNYAKSDMTQEEFVAMCAAVVENARKPRVISSRNRRLKEKPKLRRYARS